MSTEIILGLTMLAVLLGGIGGAIYLWRNP